jgi:Tfp pilus assembly protein PilF
MLSTASCWICCGQPIDPAEAELTGADENYNAGVEHMQAGRWQPAERSFRAAIAARRDVAEAHYNLGFVLQRRGRFLEALRSFQAATELDPGYASAYIGMAFVHERLGDYPAAEAQLRRAVEVEPRSAEAHRRLGDLLRDTGQPAGAREEYDRALSLDPADANARFGRGFLSLSAGDYAAGWEDYEFRKSNRSFYPALMPRWRGENPAGKRLLVYGEQGFGDTIQFLRYVPLLAERGARTLLAVPLPLMDLAAGVDGAHEIVKPAPSPPAFDWSCALGSLPLFFKTTTETIPAKIPYLSVPAERIAHFRRHLQTPHGLTVAIAWSGNPEHPNDRNRSMRFSDLAPLLSDDRVMFVVLQKSVEETAGLGRSNLRVLGPDLDNFRDIAAVMCAVDLVISVDTVFCHLAGALGRPVWTLLSLVSDWRWLRGRRDSPWYPTMRLYRQRTLGDWKSVVNDVLADLRAMH